MTTLILAQKKLLSFRYDARLFEGLADRFYVTNQKGLITFIMAFFIVLSAAVYVISLYVVFGAGFSMGTLEKRMQNLTGETISLELSLQEQKTRVFEDQNDVLLHMEKISNVKYLTPDGFVASRLPLRY